MTLVIFGLRGRQKQLVDMLEGMIDFRKIIVFT